MFDPGLPTQRVHAWFELKLPRYSSAAANSRFACTELLSGPGLPTDWARARFELEFYCYCSFAAAKSRFAYTETERMHAWFELKLPRYSSAVANSRLACTELLSGPRLPTDRARVRFELERPCYCSSAAGKSRFAYTELLSGPGLPPDRVHARFGLKLYRHRSAAAISRFLCTELLGLLLVLLMLGCPESLWVVLNVRCLTH